VDFQTRGVDAWVLRCVNFYIYCHVCVLSKEEEEGLGPAMCWVDSTYVANLYQGTFDKKNNKGVSPFSRILCGQPTPNKFRGPMACPWIGE
jgi:hypothetical protein